MPDQTSCRSVSSPSVCHKALDISQAGLVHSWWPPLSGTRVQWLLWPFDLTSKPEGLPECGWHTGGRGLRAGRQLGCGFCLVTCMCGLCSLGSQALGRKGGGVEGSSGLCLALGPCSHLTGNVACALVRVEADKVMCHRAVPASLPRGWRLLGRQAQCPRGPGGGQVSFHTLCGHPVPGHLQGPRANLSHPSSLFLSTAGCLDSSISSDSCPSEVVSCVL